MGTKVIFSSETIFSIPGWAELIFAVTGAVVAVAADSFVGV